MAGSSQPERESEVKGTVLVVDDSPVSLEMLSVMLSEDGFKVRTARNGSDALLAVRFFVPDLVLLDIVLGKMDGYAVCRRLKRDERTRDVPVIFISALEETADRVRCFEAGGVDFISKPFQVEEVLARMRTHLSLRRIHTRLEQQKAQLEQEILERSNAEQALVESEQRLQAILDNSPAVIYVKDTEGRYTLINRRYEALFHVQRDQFIGKTDKDVFSPEVAEALSRNDQVVVSSGKAMQVEEEVNHKHGLHSYISVKFPLSNVQGKIYAVCGISSDITKRKHAEIALQRAKEAAEAANRAKSSFLANMSHELRTPLNVILGFSQLLQRDTSLSAASKKHLDSINRSGEHLLGLINNVLEVSKIEAGSVTVNRATFDLYGILEDISAMFRLRSEQRGLSFEIEATSDLPRYLVGDEGKLRQVLINLLSNAVKFTDRGRIALRISQQRDLPSKSRGGGERERIFRFEVEDSGVGIDPGEMGRLFRPFEQTLSGQHKGGTGLGLAISREYATMMGGSLTARSGQGKGSVFSLTCRLGEGVEVAAARESDRRKVVGLAEQGAPPLILVVDDSQENRSFVAEMLKLVGFETLEAENGEVALSLFSSRAPALVLMDMSMPVMDGYQATRELKATAAGERTPVIAVTASAFSDERERILMTGADHFICKPFREGELLEAIGRLLGVRYLYADALAEPAAGGGARLSPEDLASVPFLLREELKRALLALNVAGIRGAIRRISVLDPQLGVAMGRLESGYQFERLLELVQE